jgi:hypothetical protein
MSNIHPSPVLCTRAGEQGLVWFSRCGDATRNDERVSALGRLREAYDQR